MVAFSRRRINHHLMRERAGECGGGVVCRGVAEMRDSPLMGVYVASSQCPVFSCAPVCNSINVPRASERAVHPSELSTLALSTSPVHPSELSTLWGASQQRPREVSPNAAWRACLGYWVPAFLVPHAFESLMSSGTLALCACQLTWQTLKQFEKRAEKQPTHTSKNQQNYSKSS